MRSLLFRGLLVSALLAAVAVPAASAKPRVHVKLSLLPLPASALGPAARSLPLEDGSGVVSNRNYSVRELSVTPNRLWDDAVEPVGPAQLGRISGYALDYGQGTSGRRGITEVWTSVDEYKTSADAKSALSWARLARQVTPDVRAEFSFSVEKEKAAALGSGRFALLFRYEAANIAPLFGLDERFSEGRYQADVTVWAGNAAAARRLAPRLAQKLDARILQALAGRLHARPVELPAAPTAGPPPGGPDLATLAVQPSDLSGPATGRGTYMSAASGISAYLQTLSPAGQFGAISQEILWFPTANEASFDDDARLPPFHDSLGLSSAGDGARGVIVQGGVEILFCSGRLEESVLVSSPDPIPPSEILSIARTVANKIDAAGLGS